MYSRCIACERRLGANSLLPHLPVGRRIAFDPERGRLWVICPHCRQWNLTPFEERWEALQECEAEFAKAEGHAAAGDIALASCGDQLELLRIGGDARPSDIANHRYGYRLGWRRTRWELTALVAALLAVAGLTAMSEFRDRGAVIGSVIVVVWLGINLAHWSRHFPVLTSLRVAARYRGPDGKRLTIRNRHVRQLQIDVAGDASEIALSCRYHWRQVRFEGQDAVELLNAVLPRVNWLAGDADTVKYAMRLVHRAEKDAPGRKAGTQTPSLWFLRGDGGTRLLALPPASLLALEILATEEHELRLMRGEALSLRRAWKKEEGIAAIADALLLPTFVTDWISRFKARRKDPASPPPP